jgi:hypothetical protein
MPISTTVMPREPRSTHRIQRQFRPITARTRFSPERLLTHPPLSSNIAFDTEPEGFTESVPQQPEGTTPLIPKPKGQAGRPGRGGYSLKECLEWPPELYSEMQVCPNSPITMPTQTLFLTITFRPFCISYQPITWILQIY